MDLPLALALVLAFGIEMYVVSDGFDLGLGILSRRRADTQSAT